MVAHLRSERVFQAIGDPTRRRILERLGSGGPRRASDIAGDHRRVTRQAISKHLAALERAGLVRAEANGRERHYTAKLEPLRQVEAWASALRLSLAAQLVRIKRSAEEGRDS